LERAARADAWATRASVSARFFAVMPGAGTATGAAPLMRERRGRRGVRVREARKGRTRANLDCDEATARGERVAVARGVRA